MVRQVNYFGLYWYSDDLIISFINFNQKNKVLFFIQLNYGFLILCLDNNFEIFRKKPTRFVGLKTFAKIDKKSEITFKSLKNKKNRYYKTKITQIKNL